MDKTNKGSPQKANAKAKAKAGGGGGSFVVGSWGAALRLRPASTSTPIAIDLNDEDSDLEVLGEQGCSSKLQLNFSSGGSTASTCVPNSATAVKAEERRSSISIKEEKPSEEEVGKGDDEKDCEADKSPRVRKAEAKAKGKAKVKGGAKEKAKAKAKAKANAAERQLPPRPESDEEEDSEADHDLSNSPLFRTEWCRIVLDEAHRIKGRTNGTAQAAFALRAKHARWCLSGTPLQNRVGEFYSIIRFLRFYPYAHYFCSKKGCDCTSLHYRFAEHSAKCRKCGHTKMNHRSHFAANISKPIQNYGFIGAGRVAMERLRGEVLDKILLRRTKLERQADVNLPTLDIRLRKDKLSEEEYDFYKSMYTQSRTEFDKYVDHGTILHNYAHVFDLIMRLRQAVDHPYLIIHGSMAAAQSIPSASRGDCEVCALCQDDVGPQESRAKATCGHSFHRDCITEYLEQAPKLPTGGIGCPACFSPLTVSFADADGEDGEQEIAGAAGVAAPATAEAVAPPAGPAAAAAAAAASPAASTSAGCGRPARGSSIMQRIKTSEFQTSTKIEALLQEITQMQRNDGQSKALVFSQFTRFLELIEWRLKKEGVSCAKLLGTMPIAARNNTIISFQTEPTLKVLLISLKAGGEGLNLQAADHIFIMDPWWNPASELQAIQRAHRIGQTRPVKAVRFVTDDTIEEKIIELQQKKQSVFDCTVGGNNKALSSLTAEDIQFLFSNN